MYAGAHKLKITELTYEWTNRTRKIFLKVPNKVVSIPRASNPCATVRQQVLSFGRMNLWLTAYFAGGAACLIDWLLIFR